MEDSDIEIQVKELDDLLWRRVVNTTIFSMENVPECINCSNRYYCKPKGKISTSEIMRSVADILRGNKESPIVINCSGKDGRRNCPGAFEITITTNQI
jgi:hypothetical protein